MLDGRVVNTLENMINTFLYYCYFVWISLLEPINKVPLVCMSNQVNCIGKCAPKMLSRQFVLFTCAETYLIEFDKFTI